MGRILALIISLFSCTAMAAQPGPAPSISLDSQGTVSGGSIVPLSSLSGTAENGIFSLFAGNVSGTLTVNDFYPFYKNGTSGAGSYRVTSGKTAYCFNISGYVTSTNAFQFVSGTAPISYGDSSITGGVYESGVAAIYIHRSSASQILNFPGMYTFSSQTYPAIQVSTSAVNYGVYLNCYEK